MTSRIDIVRGLEVSCQSMHSNQRAGHLSVCSSIPLDIFCYSILLACHWPPNAFCGLTPTPTFSARGPKGREKKGAFAQCRNYDAVDKEEAIFSLSLTPSTIPPLFGPVSRCVGRVGTGRHRARRSKFVALVGPVCGSSATAAGARFHPQIEGEPTR